MKCTIAIQDKVTINNYFIFHFLANNFYWSKAGSKRDKWQNMTKTSKPQSHTIWTLIQLATKPPRTPVFLTHRARHKIHLLRFDTKHQLYGGIWLQQHETKITENQQETSPKPLGRLQQTQKHSGTLPGRRNECQNSHNPAAPVFSFSRKSIKTQCLAHCGELKPHKVTGRL